MQRLKTSNFIGFLATVVILAFAPIASFASPTETGAVASNGAAFNNPGFDASGNAVNKVITTIRGVTPVGVPNSALTKSAGTKNNGISYYGGPVMTDSNGVKVNIVWYGNWDQKYKDLIKNMITNLSEKNSLSSSPFNNTSYYKINTTYYDNSLKVANQLSVGIETSTATNVTIGGTYFGKTLNDSQVLLLAKTISNLTDKSNSITLVLTDETVSESSGFLTKYCGWHWWESTSDTSKNTKYGFIGNPLKNTACAPQTSSPNGDTDIGVGVDAMISVIAHEIVEAVTDPLGTGWKDSRGYENADKCAWNFGTLYGDPNTAGKYNMILNGKKYLIQQNWLNDRGGLCTLGIA